MYRYNTIIIIIIIILGFNARRSPMSHLFLLSFPAIGIGSGVLGFARIGVHRPSLRLPYLMFSIRSFCHRISIVFLLYGRCIATHSVDPSLTHFLGEFPGLGLARVPDVVVPEAEQRCTWSRKLDSNFCPGRARTSDLGI